MRTLHSGFSMIEVLVTVAITAIGLLGVAKMQTAAISNTQVARVRSLIAIQASGLASSLHGNATFWAAQTDALTVTATGSTVTDNLSTMTASTNCASILCDATQLAAFDVKDWARNMSLHFPSYTGEIKCTPVTAGPVGCRISIKWNEKDVAMYKTVAAAATRTSTQEYILYVQP